MVDYCVMQMRTFNREMGYCAILRLKTTLEIREELGQLPVNFVPYLEVISFKLLLKSK